VAGDRWRRQARDLELVIGGWPDGLRPTASARRPPAVAARPRGELTPRGREVAQLVAHGLSNREIAERLYPSERTVDNHVHHVLDRLGFGLDTGMASLSG